MRECFDSVADVVKRVWEKMRIHPIGAFAANSTYFILLSALPLLVLAINIVRFLPFIDKTELVALVLEYCPDFVESYFVSAVNQIFSKSGNTIVGVSVLLLLWSASTGIHALITGLDHIGYVQKRGFWCEKGLSALFTMALIGIVSIAVLLVKLFGELNARFVSANNSAAIVLFFSKVGNPVTACLIGFIFLFLLFSASAQKGYKWRDHIVGIIFSVAGVYIVSLVFASLAKWMIGSYYIYGGVAVLVCLMIWLYTCMFMVFIGALINVVLYERKNANIHQY